MKVTTFEKYKCPNCGNENNAIIKLTDKQYIFVITIILGIYVINIFQTILYIVCDIDIIIPSTSIGYDKFRHTIYGLYFIIFKLIVSSLLLFVFFKKYPFISYCNICSSLVTGNKKMNRFEWVKFEIITIIIMIVLDFLLLLFPIFLYNDDIKNNHLNIELDNKIYNNRNINSNKKIEEWLNIQNE